MSDGKLWPFTYYNRLTLVLASYWKVNKTRPVDIYLVYYDQSIANGFITVLLKFSPHGSLDYFVKWQVKHKLLHTNEDTCYMCHHRLRGLRGHLLQCAQACVQEKSIHGCKTSKGAFRCHEPPHKTVGVVISFTQFNFQTHSWAWAWEIWLSVLKVQTGNCIVGLCGRK